MERVLIFLKANYYSSEKERDFWKDKTNVPIGIDL